MDSPHYALKSREPKTTCKSNCESVPRVWLAKSSPPGGWYVGWWPGTAAAGLGKRKGGMGRSREQVGFSVRFCFTKFPQLKKKKKFKIRALLRGGSLSTDINRLVATGPVGTAVRREGALILERQPAVQFHAQQAATRPLAESGSQELDESPLHNHSLWHAPGSIFLLVKR